MPHPGIALPEKMLPRKAGAGLVDIEQGRGAGLGIVAEPGVVEPDGIGDAAIHFADGKVKAIPPCLEGEALPHGKKESRRIHHRPQCREDDEQKND